MTLGPRAAVRRLRQRRTQPLAAFRPGPAFVAFMDDASRQQFIRAANGAGKTLQMAAKIARLLARRPGTRARWLGPTSAQVRDVAARYLWRFLAPYCTPRSRYTPGVGFTQNNTIELQNGSTLQLKSYQDKIDGQAGDSLDAVVFDEVPPFGHWEENIGRVGRDADSLGVVIVGFTAVNRPTEWFRKEIEGGEASPSGVDGWQRVEHGTGWVQYVIPLRLEYCPWHTPETFEEYAAKWRGKDTEPQRLHAAWEGAVQARRLGRFGSGALRSLEQLARLEFDEIRLGIDHGTGVGKQIAVAVGVQRGARPGRERFALLGEYVGAGGTTPSQDARGILAMLASLGIDVLQIDRAFGDIGAGGRHDLAEGGGRWNAMIEAALAEILEMDAPPFRIVVPYKRRKAGPAGEAAMNHAFAEGRFLVSRTCTHWARAAMQYTGAEEDLKDPIDASRYAIQDLLLGPMAERVADWLLV